MDRHVPSFNALWSGLGGACLRLQLRPRHRQGAICRHDHGRRAAVVVAPIQCPASLKGIGFHENTDSPRFVCSLALCRRSVFARHPPATSPKALYHTSRQTGPQGEVVDIASACRRHSSTCQGLWFRSFQKVAEKLGVLARLRTIIGLLGMAR